MMMDRVGDEQELGPEAGVYLPFIKIKTLTSQHSTILNTYAYFTKNLIMYVTCSISALHVYCQA